LIVEGIIADNFRGAYVIIAAATAGSKPSAQVKK
jgi:hypothetical protein